MNKGTLAEDGARTEYANSRIGIASDHGGYELKSYLIGLIRKNGYEVIDFGDQQPESDDDYPDYIIPLARAVASGRPSVLELRMNPEQITTRATIADLRAGKPTPKPQAKPKRAAARKLPGSRGGSKPAAKRG